MPPRLTMQAAERPLPVGSAGGPKSPPERTRVTLTNSRAAGRFQARNKSRNLSQNGSAQRIQLRAGVFSSIFSVATLGVGLVSDRCRRCRARKSQGARRSRFPAARDAAGLGKVAPRTHRISGRASRLVLDIWLAKK